MQAPGREDFDAIVIGAGHNGLATAAVLAGAGRRVLVLEKNGYVGGMSGTREILSGCRNEVGASCLFPLADEVVKALDFEAHGAEFIDLPVMAINLPGPGGTPLLFYRNPLRQLAHVLRDHGPGALLGFARMIRFCRRHPQDGACKPQLEFGLSNDAAIATLARPALAAERAKAGADHSVPGVRAVLAMAPVVQPLTPASLRAMREPVVPVVTVLPRRSRS